MKKLIDMTDDDVISVINKIHILTDNKVISRKGILGLSFEESFRKYGRASIEVEMVSNDKVTDGYYTTISNCEIVFNHKSVWFAEIGPDGEASNYNKNHFFGYLKLQELGYDIPTEPQW